MYIQPVRILREPIGIADEYHQKSVLIKSVLSVRSLEMSCVHPFQFFTQNPLKTGFCFFLPRELEGWLSANHGVISVMIGIDYELLYRQCAERRRRGDEAEKTE